MKIQLKKDLPSGNNTVEQRKHTQKKRNRFGTILRNKNKRRKKIIMTDGGDEPNQGW